MFVIDFEKHAALFQPQVLYWGIAHDYLSIDDAIVIADRLLTTGNDNAVYVDLLLTKPTEKEEALKIFLQHTIPANGAHAEKVLRYVILNEIATSATSVSEALNALEEVYADFDYPADMNRLIRYMPSDTPSLSASQEENEKRLFEKLLRFLEIEKAAIDAQSC